MESFYKYIGELDQEVLQEIRKMAEGAVRIFHITDLDDGKKIAAQVMKIVDEILESGKYPKQYGDIVDLAVGLGTVFGNALCVGYGWEWKGFGDSKESAIYGVVSPKRYFSHAPLLYLHRILTGNNTGLDGKNDNTILLLYNMLKDIDSKPGDKMYIPLA